MKLTWAFDRAQMETPTRHSEQAPPTTTCAACQASDKVTSVTITGRVVYLRCRRCRLVWCIPERRVSFRMQDARKVFDVYR
jgi:transcription elongation factor Elf1